MGLHLSKHAGDDDSAPLSVALNGGDSNRTNQEEKVEYHVDERTNPKTFLPDPVHKVTISLPNLHPNFNGKVSEFRIEEHEVKNCVIQVENEPLANHVPESGAQIEMSNLAPDSSPPSAMDTTPSASLGSAAQINGSGNEGHGSQLEFRAKFSYWAGGLSFAADIALISGSVGSNSLDKKKRLELNMIAVCLTCAFFLSLFILALTEVRRTYTCCIPTRAVVKASMAFIAILLIVAIVLGLLLLF